MANLLRYQGYRPSFVAGLEPLPEDDDRASAERYGMPAPQNASGILERNVVPGEPNPTARGQFQLEQPGDLRLPQRDDTPHLGTLTLPNAQPPRLDGGDQRRLSMVEGMPDVGPPPEPPGKPQGASPAFDPQDAFDRQQAERMQRTRRGLGIAGIVSALFGSNEGNAQRTQALQAAAQANDPTVPMERMRERQAAARQAALDAEQLDYERGMQERRFGIDERRIQQAEDATAQRLGYRDADIDPNHPNAENERELYSTWFAGLPEHIRESFPGYDPSDPNVQARLASMGAAQIRRNLELIDEQAQTRFPEARDWRSSVRTGERARRNQLAGFAAPGRTVSRGDSGLTPEQLLAADAAGEDLEAAPSPEQSPPVAPSSTRQMRPSAGGMSSRAMTPAPVAASPQASAPTPQGRPLVDRPLTPEEHQRASIDIRTTDAAIRAYMTAHVMPESRYAEAASRVNGLSPEHRSALINEWGNPRINLVPGFRRVEDTGRMTPARLADVRGYATQASTAAALSSEVLGLIDRVNSLDLAEGALTGHPLVQEMLGKARRLQTLLRVVDRTGVPTGDEQARAMQEAPEPLTPLQVIRARSAYAAYPRSILSITYRNMQAEGFAPVRGGGR